MTMSLSRFYGTPHFFKGRDFPSLNNVKFIGMKSNIRKTSPIRPAFGEEHNSKFTGNQKDTGFLLEFNVSSASDINKYYICKIWLDHENIEPTTQCQFHCSCPSFKYEFEVLLHSQGASLEIPKVPRTPRKKSNIFVCKHLATCLHVIQRYRTVNEFITRHR